MNDSTISEAVITRYLLGQLCEEEHARIEDISAADTDVFDAILIAESELIERYLQNELSPEEHRQFELTYLHSPARRRHVKNLRTLLGVASAEPTRLEPTTPSRSWIHIVTSSWNNSLRRLATGLTLMVLVLATSWVVYNHLSDTQENLKPLVFELIPGAARGSGEVRILDASPEIGTIEFHLFLEKNPSGRFRATIQSAAGNTLQVQSDLESQPSTLGRIVIVVVPANLFSSGDHIIVLERETTTGLYEISAEYQFRVVEK